MVKINKKLDKLEIVSIFLCWFLIEMLNMYFYIERKAQVAGAELNAWCAKLFNPEQLINQVAKVIF